LTISTKFVKLKITSPFKIGDESTLKIKQRKKKKVT